MRNTQVQKGAWIEWVMVHWEGCSVAEATWETDLVFYQQHYPAMLAAYNDSRVPERVVGAKLWYHPVSGEKHYKVRWQGTSWTTMERAVTLERNPVYAGLLADFRARAARNSRTRPRPAGEATRGQRRWDTAPIWGPRAWATCPVPSHAVSHLSQELGRLGFSE
jgi:hypothetical protein